MKPCLHWFFAVALCATTFADEPIMNMMPRWSGGWGYQLVQEYRHERDLLLGGRKAYPGFTEDVHLMHLEGVYTWDKSIRLTAKLPYVLDARREMPDGLGGKKTSVPAWLWADDKACLNDYISGEQLGEFQFFHASSSFTQGVILFLSDFSNNLVCFP